MKEGKNTKKKSTTKSKKTTKKNTGAEKSKKGKLEKELNSLISTIHQKNHGLGGVIHIFIAFIIIIN